jgi:hypothetical protein
MTLNLTEYNEYNGRVGSAKTWRDPLNLLDEQGLMDTNDQLVGFSEQDYIQGDCSNLGCDVLGSGTQDKMKLMDGLQFGQLNITQQGKDTVIGFENNILIQSVNIQSNLINATQVI